MPLSSLVPAALRRKPASPAGPQFTQLPPRSGYIPGIPQGGINETSQAMGAATGTDRRSLMQDLADSYLACQPAWTCIQAIARTITAGGLVSDWDADTGEGDQKEPEKPPEVVALERFYAFCNPTQDIRQILRNLIADLQVFGSAMLEIVWSGPVPVAMYNQDVVTTYPVADEHGVISKYIQVTDFGQRAEFEPREIIHISLDSARPGVFGVGPTQAMLGPISRWLFAHSVIKEMLRKGLPPTVHADMPAGKSPADMERWRGQAVAQNIGPKNIGTPWMTVGGGTLTELQSGKLADALSAMMAARDEVVGGYGVPPAEANIIESGNLGGGTGDSQHRSFQLNTCKPVAEIVLEKLNFHIAVQGFGVKGWHTKFAEVDYRDSQVVEDIRNARIATGLYTLNKGRREIGEPEVEGGNDPMYATQRFMVLYKDLPAFSKATVAGAGGSSLAPPQPPPDPDAEPGAGDDGQGDGKGDDGQETLAAVYQARFREALARYQEAS